MLCTSINKKEKEKENKRETYGEISDKRWENSKMFIQYS